MKKQTPGLVCMSGVRFGESGAYLVFTGTTETVAVFVSGKDDAKRVLSRMQPRPCRSEDPKEERVMTELNREKAYAAIQGSCMPDKGANPMVFVPPEAADLIMQYCRETLEGGEREVEIRPRRLIRLHVPKRERDQRVGAIGYTDSRCVLHAQIFRSRSQARAALRKLPWLHETLLEGYEEAIAGSFLPETSKEAPLCLPMPYAIWVSLGMLLDFQKWYEHTYADSEWPPSVFRPDSLPLC